MAHLTTPVKKKTKKKDITTTRRTAAEASASSSDDAGGDYMYLQPSDWQQQHQQQQQQQQRPAAPQSSSSEEEEYHHSLAKMDKIRRIRQCLRLDDRDERDDATTTTTTTTSQGGTRRDDRYGDEGGMGGRRGSRSGGNNNNNNNAAAVSAAGGINNNDRDNVVVNLWELRQLALSPGGLVNEELRRIAWPKLTSIPTTASNLHGLPRYTDLQYSSVIDPREIQVIRRDVGRSVWHTTEGKHLDYSPLRYTKHDERQQQVLQSIICSVLYMSSSLAAASSSLDDDDEEGWEEEEEEISPTNRTTAAARRRGDPPPGVGTMVDRWEKSTNKTEDSGEIKREDSRTKCAARMRRQKVHYYQGFHDICALFHINLTSPTLTSYVVSQITQVHLRDAMHTNFSKFARGIQLSFWTLLHAIDEDVENFLFVSHAEPGGIGGGGTGGEIASLETPVAIVSWTMTWFVSHMGNDVNLASRLVDAFLSSHALFPLYVAVALLLQPTHRHRLLHETECEFSDVAMMLVHLPKVALEEAAARRAVAATADADASSSGGGNDNGGGTTGEEARGAAVQSWIDDAISYMNMIPPKRLLDLSRKYRGGILYHPPLAEPAATKKEVAGTIGGGGMMSNPQQGAAHHGGSGGGGASSRKKQPSYWTPNDIALFQSPPPDWSVVSTSPSRKVKSLSAACFVVPQLSAERNLGGGPEVEGIATAAATPCIQPARLFQPQRNSSSMSKRGGGGLDADGLPPLDLSTRRMTAAKSATTTDGGAADDANPNTCPPWSLSSQGGTTTTTGPSSSSAGGTNCARTSFLVTARVWWWEFTASVSPRMFYPYQGARIASGCCPPSSSKGCCRGGAGVAAAKLGGASPRGGGGGVISPSNAEMKRRRMRRRRRKRMIRRLLAMLVLVTVVTVVAVIKAPSARDALPKHVRDYVVRASVWLHARWEEVVGGGNNDEALAAVGVVDDQGDHDKVAEPMDEVREEEEMVVVGSPPRIAKQAEEEVEPMGTTATNSEEVRDREKKRKWRLSKPMHQDLLDGTPPPLEDHRVVISDPPRALSPDDNNGETEETGTSEPVVVEESSTDVDHAAGESHPQVDDDATSSGDETGNTGTGPPKPMESDVVSSDHGLDGRDDDEEGTSGQASMQEEVTSERACEGTSNDNAGLVPIPRGKKKLPRFFRIKKALASVKQNLYYDAEVVLI